MACGSDRLDDGTQGGDRCRVPLARVAVREPPIEIEVVDSSDDDKPPSKSLQKLDSSFSIGSHSLELPFDASETAPCLSLILVYTSVYKFSF